MNPIRCGIVAIVCLLYGLTTFALSQSPTKSFPHLVTLDLKSTEYQRILAGSPETSTMRSGLVTLQPGKAVGRHNTGTFEELIIVLEGSGEMLLSGGESLPLAKWSAAYCPRQTEHDVQNTGTDTLRYLYIVAETNK